MKQIKSTFLKILSNWTLTYLFILIRTLHWHPVVVILPLFWSWGTLKYLQSPLDGATTVTELYRADPWCPGQTETCTLRLHQCPLTSHFSPTRAVSGDPPRQPWRVQRFITHQPTRFSRSFFYVSSLTLCSADRGQTLDAQKQHHESYHD